MGYLSALKHTNHELLEQIFSLFKASISLIGSREDQAKTILKFSRMYFDEFKVKECV